VAQIGVLRRILKKLGNDLGSEAFGIKTVGEHAAERAAPIPAVNVTCGIEDCPLEQGLPVLSR